MSLNDEGATAMLRPFSVISNPLQISVFKAFVLHKRTDRTRGSYSAKLVTCLFKVSFNSFTVSVKPF